MNHEPIYDEQIDRHMVEIIRICKENSIPFVASFQLTDEPEEQGGPLFCTSTYLPDGCAPALAKALRMIY
jgi:hypothetical protein